MISITFKISPDLKAQIAAEARVTGRPKSAIIREAIQKRYASPKSRYRPTVYELVGHLAGKVKGGPGDLSTNKKHMKGFGDS